jgi:hypothetical protein
MGWRERLRQLVLAGGSLALTGCGGGCCNANPDPCCSAPHSQECTAWMACEAEGGHNDYVPDPSAQCGNGTLRLACVHPGEDLAIPCPSPSHDLGERD